MTTPTEDTALVAGCFSVVPTRRRRFFWAAWWTAAPAAEPFRKPDASSGGARTIDEARRAAEAAAGQPLVQIDGRWAGACLRVVHGDPPFPKRRDPATAPRATIDAAPPVGSPSWARAMLGVSRDATADEIRRAFRALALTTHPDRGGDAAAFIDAKRALDLALGLARSAARPRPRRRS